LEDWKIGRFILIIFTIKLIINRLVSFALDGNSSFLSPQLAVSLANALQTAFFQCKCIGFWLGPCVFSVCLQIRKSLKVHVFVAENDGKLLDWSEIRKQTGMNPESNLSGFPGEME
jgi:hypothetical protein